MFFEISLGWHLHLCVPHSTPILNLPLGSKWKAVFSSKLSGVFLFAAFIPLHLLSFFPWRSVLEAAPLAPSSLPPPSPTRELSQDISLLAAVSPCCPVLITQPISSSDGHNPEAALTKGCTGSNYLDISPRVQPSGWESWQHRAFREAMALGRARLCHS